jgi:hypothetical protein
MAGSTNDHGFELSNMNLYFRVNSAKLWYGDGPFKSFVEAGASVLQLELSELSCPRIMYQVS